ncbi:bestrophin-3-like [Ptychodera flava]|uniref:bestrophin-3-like n=1 Tax=Ptychodera flava TaxID=63121 RepID=UPI00396A0792
MKLKYSTRNLKRPKVQEVSNYFKVLFRWKGSVYKLLRREFLVFLGAYTIISLVYRLALNRDQRTTFEAICIYANDFSSLIPVSFVLGFYVSVIIHRWWEQFLAIPWPDRLVYNVAAHVDGVDEQGKLLRRTMVRYINLSTLLLFRAVSQSVKKRFPTNDHVVNAGFMTEEERKAYEEIPSQHAKYWVPCIWFINLVRRARMEGRIAGAPAVKSIIDEVNHFHDQCDGIFGFDWVSVPLVYTQVVTIAVYTYFLACLFGRQYLDPEAGYNKANSADLYIPVFTLLQFLFYFGWLKVAEDIMDPFGEDDDDFEMNLIVDRNLQLSYLAVDDLFTTTFPLVKDLHYGDPDPEIPYTKASIKSKVNPWPGSAARMNISKKGMAIAELSAPHIRMHHNHDNRRGHRSTTATSGGKSDCHRDCIHGHQCSELLPDSSQSTRKEKEKSKSKAKAGDGESDKKRTVSTLSSNDHQQCSKCHE